MRLPVGKGMMSAEAGVVVTQTGNDPLEPRDCDPHERGEARGDERRSAEIAGGVVDRDELGKDGKSVDTDGDGYNDELDTDSDNDCVADGVDSSGGRTEGALPSADADDNCPSSAPRCDRDLGRCVMPEGAVSVDDSTVLGSGFDCSAAGGSPTLLGLLGLALSLRRRRFWR